MPASCDAELAAALARQAHPAGRVVAPDRRADPGGAAAARRGRPRRLADREDAARPLGARRRRSRRSSGCRRACDRCDAVRLAQQRRALRAGGDRARPRRVAPSRHHDGSGRGARSRSATTSTSAAAGSRSAPRRSAVIRCLRVCIGCGCRRPAIDPLDVAYLPGRPPIPAHAEPAPRRPGWSGFPADGSRIGVSRPSTCSRSGSTSSR